MKTMLGLVAMKVNAAETDEILDTGTGSISARSKKNHFKTLPNGTLEVKLFKGTLSL